MIAALALIIMTVAPTFAAERGYEDFNVHATAHADGRLEVTIDADYAFADESGRGISLAFVTRQEIEGDPNHWRRLRYSNIRAESDTAPDEVQVEEWNDGLAIYVGDPETYISGTHAYRVEFTLEGAMNPGVGAAGEDEIYWNVITAGEDESIGNVTVTLEASEPAEQVDCWVSATGSANACPTDRGVQGAVTFGGVKLPGGHGITVAASYPAGTLAGGGPILEDRITFTGVMGGIGTAGVAGLASVLALLLVPIGYRSLVRDRTFVGPTPVSAHTGQIGRAPARHDPPVQFTPPPGLTPGEAGLLVNRVFTSREITATIVDLAVRGYLHIEAKAEEKGKSNWTLTRLHEVTSGLVEHEEKLLNILFESDATVSFDALSSEQSEELEHLILAETREVTSRDWFLKNPKTSQWRAILFGFSVTALGIAATLTLASTIGYGLLGIPIVICGIAIMARSGRAVRRTAEGHALYVHAMGFRKYLETAEAEQLRFESDEDTFSRYLPYAIVFGVVDHWVELFQRLAANDQWKIIPMWYTSHLAGAHLFTSARAMDAFTSDLRGASAVATIGTMSTATTGSSGGSAFSGGSAGGFSGGGVGGGSAGSW